MKYYWLLAAVFVCVGILACAKSSFRDYPITPVAFTKVHVNDAFWAKRIKTNKEVTIPFVLEKCRETGRIENFKIAGGLKEGKQNGRYPFDDSDVYKAIEGAAYALMAEPDPKMEKEIDEIIGYIKAAQEDDGYLYTARTNKAEHLRGWFKDKRYENLASSHELYDVGHMYEAAVAYYQATGKRVLLDVAIKNADLILKDFGPGKLQAPPGHQEIELGLVKLYRTTGDSRYLDLAKFFLDIRGKALDGRKLGGKYNQDHMPVIEQEEAVGHAVRAAYMFSAMADIAALTGDDSYLHAVNKLWENVVGKKLYVTGGIGSTGSGEALGENYDLPNMSAYNETCASVANIFWNQRMFLLHGDAKYIDVLERTLYNALLSGISLEGNTFFYPNPLASVGQNERSTWFSCACCPGNVGRFIASVSGYIYAQKDDEVFVNLYIGNSAKLTVENKKVNIVQETKYPWDGAVTLKVNPEQEQKIALKLRIPGWAQDKPVPTDLYRFEKTGEKPVEISVNGTPVEYTVADGYAEIKRAWKNGDTVELSIPMPVRMVKANDLVEADKGRVTLEQGPVVFCLEFPDNEGEHVRNLLLDTSAEITSGFNGDLLGGIVTLSGKSVAYKYGKNNRKLLKHEQDFTAIPYYAWAHRGKGEMTVWIPEDESAVTPLNAPTLASKSTVTVSYGRNPEAVHDQLEPANSNDHEIPYYHWWPHKGTKEWIKFHFGKSTKVSMVEIYWFDDTGVGECRIPKDWTIKYKLRGKWVPVNVVAQEPIAKDKYNKKVFEKLKTTGLRIEIQSQDGFAGGIHECKIE